jgi:iron(III) transport system substrate-binding protein
MIAHIGPEATEIWAKGLVANFARVPQGGDRDQIRAVAAGECDVAIVNTYYLARLAKSEVEKDREVAQKVAVFWPNQQGRGTHVNISGAGVTRSAKNRGNAIRLLEFLSSEEAQRIYAEVVNEYPVKPGAPVSDTVASWGPFKADDLNLAVLARHHAEAMRIVDRVGWR